MGETRGLSAEDAIVAKEEAIAWVQKKCVALLAMWERVVDHYR